MGAELFIRAKDMRTAAILIMTCLATAPRAETVTVFAAASLANALDAVALRFEAESGNHVVISYAGSGALAQQIINGAPADVFLSASVDWMDAVAAEGLILDGGRVDLLGNTLVLIAQSGAAPVEISARTDLIALLGDGRLAMGLVDSVPAGQYGKTALEHLGLWDRVKDHVAQVDNVRAALALVARGEAPLGIVYATDAAAESGVALLGAFPDDSHPAITYPAGLLAETAAARAFFTALQSPEAGAVFAAQGFTVLGGGP